MNERTDIEKAFEAGKIAGKEHSASSPETLKIVGDLKTDLKVYCAKMEDLSIKVDEHHKEVMDAIKELANKKADKWVENVMRWFLYSIALGFLAVLGTLIYNSIIHFSKGI
jgi:hypothetical protein